MAHEQEGGDGVYGAEVSLPDPPLAADGVELRPLAERDVDDLVAACNDPEAVRWLPQLPHPYTADDARQFVRSRPSGFASGTDMVLAVADADAGDSPLLGTAGLTRPDAAGRVIEVGYWVAPWARGRGVATTATRLLAAWGLEDLGYERIELYAAAGNAASQRVAERAGFTREGVLRGRAADRDGNPRDLVAYGMLRGEQPPRPGPRGA